MSPASLREKLAEAQSSLDDLPFLIWQLLHSAELITNGERTHGAYAVPWGTLSWSRDVANKVAERLEDIVGPVCRECRGRGVIDNPEARYEMDYVEGRATGIYSTNDAEEIECPRCDGIGLEPPPEPEPKTSVPGTFNVERDDDLPF